MLWTKVPGVGLRFPAALKPGQRAPQHVEGVRAGREGAGRRCPHRPRIASRGHVGGTVKAGASSQSHCGSSWMRERPVPE